MQFDFNNVKIKLLRLKKVIEMKTVLNWLLVMFAIMFWAFRLVVTFLYSMKIEFMFEPIDMNIEVILLFVTILTIILIAKRKLLGGILYFLTYGRILWLWHIFISC